MMKIRTQLAAQRYAALAMAGALALGIPRTGRAGQLTVIENTPNSYTNSYTLGAGVNAALAAGQSYNYMNQITTPDGQFKLSFDSITASNPMGVPNIGASMTITDELGGAGSVYVQITQSYTPSSIFAAGCYDGEFLGGSFAESASHGDSVVGTAIVGGRGMPNLVASDLNGPTFGLTTGYLPYLFPSPTSFEVQLTFNFAAGSQVGDAISIPFTILSPSLSSVPEPASWVMAVTAGLAGLGCWSYRRRYAPTCPR
jgi:hypothetical protein